MLDGVKRLSGDIHKNGARVSCEIRKPWPPRSRFRERKATLKEQGMATQCLDDPGTILQKEWCISALSKDLSGELRLTDSKSHSCHTPSCRTLKTVHGLKVNAVAHQPCDSPSGRLLDGTIVVERLVTVFDQDGTHRGFHAGDFVWHGAAGVQAAGRISGVTNVGTHRAPAFSECQKCDERGVMEGRLCGQITSTSHAALNGCQIIADYRVRFDPSTTGGQGGVRGTLEGVIVCSCQQ
jgi:hypothetical protein